MRLDCYDADTRAHMLGRAFFGLKQYAEAISAFIRVPGEQYAIHAFMAAANAYLGQAGKAADNMAEVLRLKPDFNCAGFSGNLFYEHDEDQEHLLNGLCKAGLP